jgi:hypothetical protein
MSVKCRIWWDESAGAYVVSISYNQNFVDGVKQYIPAGSRTYDTQTKFWHIAENYGEFVRKLAESKFGAGGVSFTSRTATSQQRTYSPLANGDSTEVAILAFFNLVPYDAAKRCFLLAAQSLHPDKNPENGEKMTKLNVLWSRIEKEFYKR